MLLAEYAVTPDVFDQSSYSGPDVCGVHLQYLRNALLNEALVRDLRNGQWSELFANDHRPWHSRSKELFRTLAKQGRLRLALGALNADPATDTDWCAEAIASHQREELTGIIATQAIKQGFQSEPLVARVDRVLNAPWWAGRSPSVRLNRTVTDYIKNLRLILSHANSLQFIDPHLDPRQSRYRDFLTILQKIPIRRPLPQIEVHRRCYFDNQNKTNQHDEAGWRRLFDSWTAYLRQKSISVEVFIWDDFHDRYMISNLVGISIPNGFDTTTSVENTTTWTRLGRKESEEVAREFELASKRHTLHHRFRVSG